MARIIVRFLIGGAVVSIFVAIGDVLKPRVSPGLFGAVPSVSLATLGTYCCHLRCLLCRNRGTLDDRGSDGIVRLCLFRQENEEGQIFRCMSWRADFILVGTLHCRMLGRRSSTGQVGRADEGARCWEKIWQRNIPGSCRTDCRSSIGAVNLVPCEVGARGSVTDRSRKVMNHYRSIRTFLIL
jgi:hypothetical protein